MKKNSLRIVILGSGGRLGAALCDAYRPRHQITGFTHADLDLCDLEAVRRTLEPLPFDVLINCAALTNVDYCETHREEAFLANAEAVGVIGGIAVAKRARAIHISTDYVFTGDATEPYVEEDAAHPINVYGESKRAGEIALLATSSHHLAVRVSWLFGPHRASFVDKILERALQSDQVAAIADKFSSPTYSLDLAAQLEGFLHEIPTGGLLHLCNDGGCSWQEFGQFALDCAAAAGLPVQTKTVERLTLADMKTFVAQRPIQTVLCTEKLRRLHGNPPRPWRAAVEDYVRNCFVPSHRRG